MCTESLNLIFPTKYLSSLSPNITAPPSKKSQKGSKKAAIRFREGPHPLKKASRQVGVRVSFEPHLFASLLSAVLPFEDRPANVDAPHVVRRHHRDRAVASLMGLQPRVHEKLNEE